MLDGKCKIMFELSMQALGKGHLTAMQPVEKREIALYWPFRATVKRAFLQLVHLFLSDRKLCKCSIQLVSHTVAWVVLNPKDSKFESCVKCFFLLPPFPFLQLHAATQSCYLQVLTFRHN